jgi:hypothetical protein
MTWEDQLQALYRAIEKAEQSKAKSNGVRQYHTPPGRRVRVDDLEIEISPAYDGGYDVVIYSGRRVVNN